MIHYLTYNRETGEIQTTGSVPSQEYLVGESQEVGLIIIESPVDSTTHCVVDGELFFRGEPPTSFHFWDGEQWQLDAEREGSWLEASVRARRDQVIRRHVDSINPMRWASLSEEQRQAWSDYRQALLDVPQQDGFPRNVVWPSKPQ